jgi:carbon monoxide dehydrogenase subunit G
MMRPMKVTHTATYDAPLADVHAMLTDPEFRRYSADATGVLSAEVTVESTDAGEVVTIDQVQPTEGVPSFAKKFAGETTRAVQVETWSSPSEATLTVQTPGRPTDISGRYVLTDEGGRTTQTFTGELKVKVPLIRDRLEKLMAQLFVEGRDKEQAAGAAWLRGER